MSMGISGVSTNTISTQVAAKLSEKETEAKATETTKPAEETKDNVANTTGVRSVDSPAGESLKSLKAATGYPEATLGVRYEKGTSEEKKGTYSINKMSQSERDALVKQLKADAEQRQSQLMSMVEKTLHGQVGTFGVASGNDVWKTLASGNFKVDAATKAQAQRDIGEDGYWGVKQTSQRLFDFASALAGDDVNQMKKMQSAMEKGFKQATAAWGRDLPSISKQTLDAANKLFDDYYKSKETATTQNNYNTDTQMA